MPLQGVRIEIYGVLKPSRKVGNWSFGVEMVIFGEKIGI